MPLTLAGTIIHSDPSKSLGTVRFNSSGSSDAYRVKGKISTLATVVELKRETMLIINYSNQKKEVLHIPAYDSSKAASAKAIDSGTKEMQVSRSMIDQVTKDLPRFLQDAGSRPVMGADGKISAFELTFIKPGSVFDQLGLKVGDKILTVNGQRVTSVQAAVEVYNQLRDSSMIDLKIGRGDREVPITYYIR